MFFLVSGSAASGKTTVARNIAARVERLESHDLDEKIAVDEYTRCQQLEEWVRLALVGQLSGSDFLLTSHSPLGELLACPSAPRLNGIAACLLDCRDTVRITRMRQRGIDPRWPPSQDILSWAAWHRMHAWDPQWEQAVITGNGPPDHIYERWKHWQQTDERWRVAVIDTSDATIEQVLDEVAAWVKAERGKTPLLTPETKWWGTNGSI
jgi:hypothetical protein